MKTGATSTVSPALVHRTAQVENLSSTSQTSTSQTSTSQPLLSHELLSVTQQPVQLRHTRGTSQRECVADSRRCGVYGQQTKLLRLDLSMCAQNNVKPLNKADKVDYSFVWNATSDALSVLKQRMGTLREKLKPNGDSDPRYLTETNGNYINRFRDIRANAATAVGSELNANRIAVAGNNVAIACQYPLEHQLENHLKMLVDNRTPVLTVLASKSEVDYVQLKMPDYFTQSKIYPGGISTESRLKKTVSLGDGVEANIYHLAIRGYDKAVSVDVVHVHNWPDKTAVTAKVTKKLAAKVNEFAEQKVKIYADKRSRAVNDPEKLLPVLHCRAGVGRTGQVIAAMVMEKENKDVSLQQIITDMRNARNGVMVQKDEQLDVLAEIAQQQDRALIW